MNSEKPDYDRIINFANDDKEQLRFGVGHFVDVFCKNKEVISGIIINYDLGEETLFLQSEDYYPHLFIAFGAIDKIIVYEEAKRITYGKVRYIGPTTTYSNGITLYQNELYECLDLMKTMDR